MYLFAASRSTVRVRSVHNLLQFKWMSETETETLTLLRLFNRSYLSVISLYPILLSQSADLAVI